jgi:hypothetical protein
MSRALSRGLSCAAAIAAACGLASFALAGCVVVRTVRKVEGAVQSNSAVINLFTSDLKSGQPSTFQVTYTTTGSSPSKIVYAVRPPDELAFTDSQTGSSGAASTGDFELIMNSGGQYLCTHAAAGSAAWSCRKLPKSGAAAERGLLDFYTAAHWVSFLKGFALAAGFAGDKVSSSTTTVNGFAMQCVDLVASGVTGTSRICSTAQHLLGYVQVASRSTGFEITSYTASPLASVFELPAGAAITNSGGV